MPDAHEIEVARDRMVERQIRARGIDSPRVLEALRRVERHRFVPQLDPVEAYDDRAWSIGYDQTISQPYMVALMTDALALAGDEHVLEIGTGSGYQAAVLAELARDVVTVERIEELARPAARVLDELGYKNVEVITSDGTLGWPAGAPYDRILVAAATDEVPPALLQQLAEGGILAIPVGPGDSQMLQAIRRVGERFQTQNLSGCRFVPLIADQ